MWHRGRCFLPLFSGIRGFCWFWGIGNCGASEVAYGEHSLFLFILLWDAEVDLF